jgi:hypothetical protein
MSSSSLLIDLIPATNNTVDAFQICEKIALFSPSVNLARILPDSTA